MSQTKVKKKEYKGKNVRIATPVFDKLKSVIDEKGWKLGRFVEDAVTEKLSKIK